MMLRSTVGFLPVASAAFGLAAPADAQQILFAGGGWAALGFGDRCEARSGALSAGKGATPVAGFAFDRSGGAWGQFYVRLSRPPRAVTSVIATIGNQPFLLAARGGWAWSRGAGQQKAMIDAARSAGGMRVESRDSSGRRIVDRYLLAGAATAIDAAAAECSKAGKSR